MPLPLPQVNALVFCDQAFQQAVTGKWCIIGTFGVIWVREFPATHAPLSVFVSLSDFNGDATVQLTVRDEDGEHVVSVRVQVPKLPLPAFEFNFAFPPVTFKKPGVHTVELMCGGQLLTVRSLRVEKIDPTKMPFPFGLPQGPDGTPGPGANPSTEPEVGPGRPD